MAKSPVFHRGGSHAVLPLRTVNFLTAMTGVEATLSTPAAAFVRTGEGGPLRQ